MISLHFKKKYASKEMLEMLKKLREKIMIAVVGGSDLAKQKKQLGEGGKRERKTRKKQNIIKIILFMNDVFHQINKSWRCSTITSLRME